MFENLLGESGLSLDRLRNFLLVAEAGSIARAAQADPSRQALYSRQIRELEAFFCTQLTERKGKGIVISKAGQRLAMMVREHLQGLDDFKHEQANLPKQFVFGAGASVLEWLLLPKLHEVSDLLGKSAVKVESHRTLALIDAIREGRLDFALVREDAVLPSLPGINVAKRAEFFLCVPGAMVRQRGPVVLTQPRGWGALPLAVPTTGGQFHDALERAFDSCGEKLRPAVECHSFLHVRQLIETGHYAGVLPAWGATGLEQQGVVQRPFAPLKDYGRPLCLHWNKRQVARRGLDESVVGTIASVLGGFAKRPS